MAAHHLCSIFMLLCAGHVVFSHTPFSRDACLSAHNELRGLHEGTNNVEYDDELERSAQETAEFILLSNSVIDK